jgi:stage V sporulation protein T
MKSTGIVRRIDDLGRVVIPKEIRKKMGVREGDPMEIFIEGRKLVIEKYFPMGQYTEQAAEYVRSFQSVTQRYVFVTDTEKIIASSLHNLYGAPLSDKVVEAIRSKNDIENIPFLAGENSAVVEYASIIRDGSSDGLGDGIGAVVLVQNGPPADEVIKAQVKIAADFLGRLASTERSDTV